MSPEVSSWVLASIGECAQGKSHMDRWRGVPQGGARCREALEARFALRMKPLRVPTTGSRPHGSRESRTEFDRSLRRSLGLHGCGCAGRDRNASAHATRLVKDALDREIHSSERPRVGYGAVERAETRSCSRRSKPTTAHTPRSDESAEFVPVV